MKLMILSRMTQHSFCTSNRSKTILRRLSRTPCCLTHLQINLPSWWISTKSHLRTSCNRWMSWVVSRQQIIIITWEAKVHRTTSIITIKTLITSYSPELKKADKPTYSIKCVETPLAGHKHQWIWWLKIHRSWPSPNNRRSWCKKSDLSKTNFMCNHWIL